MTSNDSSARGVVTRPSELRAARGARSGTFTFYTVGHAAHPIGEFEALLGAFGIRVLADVRLAPGSRHSPQFNGDALAASLRAASIGYVHLPELGGWRTARRDSPNGGWTNRSFQGYADHMATPEFERGMERLLAAAGALPASGTGSVACMCAEGLWWRCHRRLLSDALLARGHQVVHILPDGRGSRTPSHPGPWPKARLSRTRPSSPRSASDRRPSPRVIRRGGRGWPIEQGLANGTGAGQWNRGWPIEQGLANRTG